jgi:hypothetical protein
VGDIINRQKNDILWGNETGYDLWETTGKENEIAKKIVEYNGKVERINIITIKTEEETSSTTSTENPQKGKETQDFLIFKFI